MFKNICDITVPEEVCSIFNLIFTKTTFAISNSVVLDLHLRPMKTLKCDTECDTADGHLSQSQKASHWPLRPRLKGPPWSQMANTS